MTHSTTARRQPTPQRKPKPIPTPHYGVMLGLLVDFQPPIVEFEDPDGDIIQREALCTIALNSSTVGHSVVLMFVDGDLDRPIITGHIDPGIATPKKKTRTKTLTLDGRELVLEADAALTLRCGKSSITLTREGRLVLRGTSLVSHASGVNRIRGGTIKLN